MMCGLVPSGVVSKSEIPSRVVFWKRGSGDGYPRKSLESML
jgi:hypothetical protein